eukprot:4749939-Amphidinium_carterae.1
MEPTPEERAELVNLGALAEWCQMRPAASAALLQRLGFEDTSHIRSFAMMEHAWMQNELRVWQIEGNDPVAADYCHAALMLRTA